MNSKTAIKVLGFMAVLLWERSIRETRKERGRFPVEQGDALEHHPNDGRLRIFNKGLLR
jgi:hypothetical protein